MLVDALRMSWPHMEGFHSVSGEPAAGDVMSAAPGQSARWHHRGPFAQADPLPPVAATERGLAVGAAIWQGLWQAGVARDMSGWPTVSVWLFWLAAASVAGLLLTSWPGWHRRAQVVIVVIDIVVLLLAGSVLIVVLPMPAGGGLTTGALLCTLAAGVAGLMLPTRQAAVVIGLVAASQFTLLLLLLGDKPGLELPTVLLSPLNGFLMAVVTLTARRTLIGSAEAAERAGAALLAAEASAASVAATEQRLLHDERLLHETVLNTLTAIVRGGIGASEESRALLRTRSNQSAQVLEGFDTARTTLGHPDPVADVREAVELVRASGASVVLDIASLARLDGAVYDAFIGAVREALANAARHASATTVSVTATVTVTVTGNTGAAATVVVRDDGVGFDPRSVSARFGIDRAITASMSLVGGTARIQSAPGNGAAVTLQWRAQIGRRSVWFGIDRDAFTIPVIAAYGVFGALSIALTWSGVSEPMLSLAAAALTVVAGAALINATRRGPLTTGVVLVVLALAPLIYRLQKLSTIDSATPWIEWSSTIISGLFLVVAARGPWWAWIAALSTWLMIQGDPMHEMLQPGSAIIVAGGILAHLMRTSAAELDASIEARAAQEAEAQSAEYSIARLRTRYAALGESDAGRLLTAIADDMLDPGDEAVRANCSAEEGFIRAVMRLEPDADWLQGLAFDLSKQARERGVRLDVDVAAGPSAIVHAPVGLIEACSDALAIADPGEPCRLTARQEETELAIRLVLRAADGSDVADIAAAAAAYGILIHRDPSAVMIEARIGNAGQATPETVWQESDRRW